MPQFTIDGRVMTVPDGATVLDAAQLAEIEIPTLCHLPGRPPETSCFVCLVRVEGIGRFLPACATRVTEGMVVHNASDEVRDARRTAIELLLSDHLGDCVAPCQGVCPAHMDIPKMMELTAKGQFRDAHIVVKQAIPLPAILGRVCPELCEKGCRRAAHDGSLSICMTKRFLADHDLETGDPYLPPMDPASGRSVAVVGAGPAGLSAAYYLRTLGHACVVYDDREAPGGMLRYGTSRDVLPLKVLDDEIALIERMGAVFRSGFRIGEQASVEELQQDCDTVILASGDAKSGGHGYEGIERGPQGIKVDRRTLMTSRPGVFAAGGALLPLKHAIRALADGRIAAYSASEYMTGVHPGETDPGFSVHVGKLDADTVRPYLRFGSSDSRQTPEGGCSAGFTIAEVQREASRCLQCGCPVASTCSLRAASQEYGAQPLHFSGARREFGYDDSHPDIIFDSGKCTACGICVRIAAEGREELGVGFTGRGFDVRTSVPFSSAMVEGLRDVALACADACPTGALVRKTDL